MQMQWFDTMDQANNTYPRLLAKVSSPNTRDTRAMLNKGQAAIGSPYHVRAK